MHTPGPWAVVDGVSTKVNLINDARGFAVGEVSFADFRKPADARLVAAAPELLAALQAIVSHHGLRAALLRDGYQEQLDAARAAIAKATGV